MLSFRSSTATLLACVILLIIPAATFGGKEKEFLEFNFAVTVPDGWQNITQQVAKPGICAALGAPDKSGTVLVVRDDTDPSPGELDERFVTQYEEKAEQTGGGKRISGKFIVVEGIKSYERTAAPTIQGKAMTSLSHIIPVQGHFYSITGMRWDGRTAADDPEIRGIVESFRFLTAPTPVYASSHATKGDAEVAEAFRRGQDAAPLFDFLIIVGVIVGIVIFFIWRRGKSRGKQAGPPPPPLRQTPPPPPLARNLQPPPLPTQIPPSSATVPAESPVTQAGTPPPPAPPIPPQPPAPPASVIRPRQRHMRE